MVIEFYCDNSRHLVCKPYSIENLHTMASELGIAKCWFHPSKGNAHYDIPKKRIQEIQDKCTIISTKALWKIIQDC